MAEQHRFPRGLLHPTCEDQDRGHFCESDTCAEVDEKLAWALIVNRTGLNADMRTGSGHTAEEFVWDFDREEA